MNRKIITIVVCFVFIFTTIGVVMGVQENNKQAKYKEIIHHITHNDMSKAISTGKDMQSYRDVELLSILVKVRDMYNCEPKEVLDFINKDENYNTIQKYSDATLSNVVDDNYIICKDILNRKQDLQRMYDNQLKSEQERLEKTPKAPFIGMTKEALKNCTWGKPDDINIYEGNGYYQEQWVWDYRYNIKCVYVDESGIVTDIQR